MVKSVGNGRLRIRQVEDVCSWRTHRALFALWAGFAIGCADSVVGTDSKTAPDLPVVEALTPVAVSGIVARAVEPAPRVVVKDRDGRPMPGLRLLFFTEGGGTVLPAGGEVLTDNLGVAELREWRLPTSAGTSVLVVFVANRTVAHFTAQARPDVPATLSISRQPEVGFPAPLKLTATATDQFGNVVDKLAGDVLRDGGRRIAEPDRSHRQRAGGGRNPMDSGPARTEYAPRVERRGRNSILVTVLDPAAFTFYDLLSINDNYNSQILSGSGSRSGREGAS